MEVDFACVGERFLVALEDPPEHRKKRRRPLLVAVGAGAFGNVLEGQPAALEVLQEGRHQPRERVDPPLSVENVEHLLARNRRESDPVSLKLLRQVPEQPAVGLVRD